MADEGSGTNAVAAAASENEPVPVADAPTVWMTPAMEDAPVKDVEDNIILLVPPLAKGVKS
jgi:hypothetical protein